MKVMSRLRKLLGDIIFEHNTPASRFFDIALLIAILLSVILIMLESVSGINARFGRSLRTLEWIFTILFTIEYLVRLIVARKRWRYVTSFFGVVDLLAILPSYLSLFLAGSQYFIVIRSLRLLRVFRILKMVRFIGEASTLARALRGSRAKIIVFLIAVVSIVVIIGSVMFLVEGPEHGFNNIPLSVYWAIVTLTTVGYGDITPSTPFGRFLASIIVILGYAIIAVPTGIVSVELNRAERTKEIRCHSCQELGHDPDAFYCKYCGEKLNDDSANQSVS